MKAEKTEFSKAGHSVESKVGQMAVSLAEKRVVQMVALLDVQMVGSLVD